MSTITIDRTLIGKLIQATAYAVDNRFMDARSLRKDGDDDNARDARNAANEWLDAWHEACALMPSES